MRIITKGTLNAFIERHPASKKALNEWFLKTKITAWSSLKDIKTTFNSVDYVNDDLYVFNIGGNKYRLVARIFFGAQLVYIRFIGTHSEYDKLDIGSL